MKYSLDISNFLDEISSISHSFVFLYFFACSLKKALSLLAILYNCIQMLISFLFSFAFHVFSQLFVRPPLTTIVPFAFLFLRGGLYPCLLYNVMNLCP